MTDQDILNAYSENASSEAFTEIVQRYSGPVYSSCMRILGNRHEAEDAAQEVFIVFARKAREKRIGDSLPGWLVRTAEYVSRNARRARVRRTIHERETEPPAPVLPAEPGVEAAAWAAIRPHLDEALAELPAAQRDALILRYLRGLDRAAIAREMGCAERTVNTWLTRGLERLREGLGRRGITIAGALLAVLLSTRAADAAAATLAAGDSAAVASGAATAAGALAASESQPN